MKSNCRVDRYNAQKRDWEPYHTGELDECRSVFYSVWGKDRAVAYRLVELKRGRIHVLKFAGAGRNKVP